MMNSQGRPGRGPRRDAAKERMWRRHVGRQAKSRRSVRDYCAVAGISEPSFYAWRRELAERDAVTFLARTERNGIELRHCPAYIREWVTRERGRS